MELSIVVPFHRNLEHLDKCLSALRAAALGLAQGISVRETIVVADGASEDSTAIALANGAMVLAVDGPSGPAVARNRGAAVASGDVLVFVDSDVVVSRGALGKLARTLVSDPNVAAVFGAYDEHPADGGFMSQGKNLAHSFTHQRSPGEARTFWAGLGAVRAHVFAQVGGFDERLTRPSVEDIDLGYRIRAAGGRIQLDSTIQGQHLKRWTFGTALVSDIRDRGIPWTQLLHRYGGLHDYLNVTISYRVCVVVAYGLTAALLLSLRWPVLLKAIPFGVVALWLLDRPYYQFFASRRGVGYAVAWFPVHVLHHLCNGVSFFIGTVLYASKWWTGVSLPGALPVTPWSVREHVIQPHLLIGAHRASAHLDDAAADPAAAAR
jgi:glycosyltransferase involved in cell wall biosynthesis